LLLRAVFSVLTFVGYISGWLSLLVAICGHLTGFKAY
jgi:hypothetical protein